jgi:GTPase SAR1 family protein
MFRNSDKIDDLLELEEKYLHLKDDYLTFTFIDTVEKISQRDDGYSAYKKDDLEDIQILLERFDYIIEKSIFENYTININGKDEDEVFKIVLEKIKEKFDL